jgi:light-regulated signal transduction histidine kinase (bacteriophytochrome)
LLDCEPKEFEPSFEKFLTFVHPDDLDQVERDGEMTLKTEALEEKPYRIISKNGTVKYLRTIGSFRGDNNNRILFGTVQDVSREIKVAEELRAKNLELENTNAELTSFTYVASHDLQEPLRKIQLFSKHILEGEQFSVKTQHNFNRIIAAGQRMQNLIVSLLDFSRMSATEIIFEPCNLNTILAESIEDLQVNINEKQAVVEYHNLPVVSGSYIQLLQLFTNLIDNAIKYSKPGVKPIIRISSSIVQGKDIENFSAHQKEYHLLKIKDNGIGFEKEYANKIFEIFQRLHGKHEYSGTGIGLAIVKKIVTNHNGFIVAEGFRNIGSTFSIYIPTA